MNILNRENVTNVEEGLVAAPWNTTIGLRDITMDRNFALLLVSLVSAALWLVYITYYNSRVLGFLLTRLINKFYFQDENFKIGKFQIFFLPPTKVKERLRCVCTKLYKNSDICPKL